MKNCVNKIFPIYYYSFKQQIKRNNQISYNNRPYKIEIKLCENGHDYLVEISDLISSDLIEVIESARFDMDTNTQTNFYAKMDNRQCVIFWDTFIKVGLAYTNIRGFDLLLNIFDNQENDLLDPSGQNMIEFLRSSAPFVKDAGYNKYDIWGRMRYITIQYILNQYPQLYRMIPFASQSETRIKSEPVNEQFQYISDSMRMISSECDRCAGEMVNAVQSYNSKIYMTNFQNIAILNGIYITGLNLLKRSSLI